MPIKFIYFKYSISKSDPWTRFCFRRKISFSRISCQYAGLNVEGKGNINAVNIILDFSWQLHSPDGGHDLYFHFFIAHSSQWLEMASNESQEGWSDQRKGDIIRTCILMHAVNEIFCTDKVQTYFFLVSTFL